MPVDHEAPGRCPVCHSTLRVSRLRCSHCGTAIEGDFRPNRFDRLTREQRDFAELFVAARGNLRELERMLGLSYPTVRSRLETVIQALGYPAERRGAEPPEEGAERRVEETPAGATPGTASGVPAGAGSQPAAVASRPSHREVLDALEQGRISAAEALARLGVGSASGRAGDRRPAETPSHSAETVRTVNVPGSAAAEEAGSAGTQEEAGGAGAQTTERRPL